MKKFTLKHAIAMMALVCMFMLPGCNRTQQFLEGTGRTASSIFTPPTATPTKPSPADERQFETIGQEFATYSANDDMLTQAQKAQDAAVLAGWQATGSTVETYAYVAPRYAAYVNQDGSLALSSKAIRMDNLTAWKILLDSKAVPPQSF